MCHNTHSTCGLAYAIALAHCEMCINSGLRLVPSIRKTISPRSLVAIIGGSERLLILTEWRFSTWWRAMWSRQPQRKSSAPPAIRTVGKGRAVDPPSLYWAERFQPGGSMTRPWLYIQLVWFGWLFGVGRPSQLTNMSTPYASSQQNCV